MRRLALLLAATLHAQDALYLATIAAAGASLRLHETADAKRWLGQAPPRDRHWEWHYLQAQANQASAEFQAHQQQVTSVAFSPNGKLVATTSSDKTVRLWSTQTRQMMHECKGHTAAVWSAAFSPDSARVVSGASDGTIRIWSAATGAQLAEYPTDGRGITAVDWSSDGDSIAASSWRLENGVAGIVRLFDAHSGARSRAFNFGVKPITAIRFSPDSKTLAAATWDSWVGLWDLRAGTDPIVAKVPPENGAYSAIQSLTFHPNGKQVATAGKDGACAFSTVQPGRSFALSMPMTNGQTPSSGRRMEIGSPRHPVTRRCASGARRTSLPIARSVRLRPWLLAPMA